MIQWLRSKKTPSTVSGPQKYAPQQGPVEAGSVQYRGSGAELDAALGEGKPVAVIFQEIPGCVTCRNFGVDVLSHPLIVEALETLFTPVLVRNNTDSRADARVLRRFREPAWNNPVVRFLDTEGNDLAPRVADGRWSVGPVATAMRDALVSHGSFVPTWLGVLAEEEGARELGAHSAVFAMFCFWTGEAAFAGLSGVIATRAAWYNGREVVDVTYNPRVLSYEDLVAYAIQHKVADRVYYRSAEEKRVAKALAPEAATHLSGQPRTDKDTKHVLRQSALARVPLTELQQTMINRMLGARNADAAHSIQSLLSPRQLAMLGQVKNSGEPWPVTIGVPIHEAWQIFAAK